MAGEADGAVWAAGGGAAIIETSPVGVAPELKKIKIVIFLFYLLFIYFYFISYSYVEAS